MDEDQLLATMNAALTAEEEEERAIEERRRKRAEILAKHKKTEEHTGAIATRVPRANGSNFCDASLFLF